jgi:Sap, sulfolipid-1-addressing protein
VVPKVAAEGTVGAMWQALGALLPIAVAVALSSVPLTVTILILLSPNRGRAALPFLAGWVIGVAAVISLSAAGAAVLSEPLRRRQDTAMAIFEILIGSALMVLAAVYLRRHSQAGTGLPRWLTAVESFGPFLSFGIAVALSFRPKGFLLGIAGGVALSAASVKPDEAVLLIIIYTAIATSTVVVPIVASFVAPRKMEAKLVSARDWLTGNGRILTSLIMFVIGVVILGSGLVNL